MKVALIAPTHLPARRANTVQVMKMAQAITEIGCQVDVLVPFASLNRPFVLDLEQENRPADGFPAWGDLARHYGLIHRFRVIWLPSNAKLRGYDYAVRAVSWARKSGVDRIYTRLPQAAALASLIGYPTIYEIHDMIQGHFGPSLFRLFLRGRGAQTLVIITQTLFRDLSRHYIIPNRPRFVVIAPDGVDLGRYQLPLSLIEARAILPLDLRKSQFVAGYTGHLYEGRGVELILALAARLSDVMFLLVGGEPADVQKYRSMAQEGGLKNVVLTGFVANTELPKYQAACNVLLMPYQPQVAASSGGNIANYLSPMKLFEYLAVGRPILASALPVLQEVLHEGNSILLSPQNVDAWVSAIMELRLNPARGLNLAVQGQNDAKRYTWKERAARILGNDLDFS